MSDRRSLANRTEEQEQNELAGLRFDEAKWQHPYNATSLYPAEFIRQQQNGDLGIGAGKIYGKPVADLSERGGVEWLMYKLMPGASAQFRVNTQPTLDEFRRAAPPVSVFSNQSFGFASMGLLGSMGHRYAFRQPMNARIHSTIFCTVSMFWAGYQWHKYRSMLELGDFKYAVEFAERHSDIINKQKPAMFGDPQILEHWKMNFLGVN